MSRPTALATPALRQRLELLRPITVYGPAPVFEMLLKLADLPYCLELNIERGLKAKDGPRVDCTPDEAIILHEECRRFNFHLYGEEEFSC